uniref:Uncharacterized protein n=1 Tax=Ciona savignyi TaxID=51511 RepID=H2Y7T2_CIOSA
MCALTIHEIQIMCENRSIVLDYSVPNIYGNTVTVLFCHPGQGINYCGAEILILRNQPLRSMLVLSLPEHEKQSLEYIVIVQTTRLVKKSLLISFYKCNESSYPTPIFTYLTVPVFILPVACFLVYVLYCKKCTLHQNMHTNKSQPAFQPSSKISKIYIIFVDDHPLHIE